MFIDNPMLVQTLDMYPLRHLVTAAGATLFSLVSIPAQGHLMVIAPQKHSKALFVGELINLVDSLRQTSKQQHQ